MDNKQIAIYAGVAIAGAVGIYAIVKAVNKARVAKAILLNAKSSKKAKEERAEVPVGISAVAPVTEAEYARGVISDVLGTLNNTAEDEPVVVKQASERITDQD